MCIACKNLSKVWDGSQKLLVSRFTNAKTGEPTFLLVQGQGKQKDPQSVVIAVRFCPWCGERLYFGKEIEVDNNGQS